MMRPSHTPRHTQQGMSLIEMMVALVVGMILSLAVFGVMTVAESRRRTTTTMNTVQADGQFAIYQLEKWLRSAGSGLSQSASYAFGCKLIASRSSTKILPRSAALPDPFASVTTGTANVFRLAPVLILPDQTTPNQDGGLTSDVLIVMASSNGGGAYPVKSTAAAGSAQLNLINTVNFNASDVVLVASKDASTTVPDCTVSQVSSSFVGSASSTALTLAGTYHDSSNAPVSGYTGDHTALNLGRITTDTSTNNPPQFMVVGVGDYNKLFAFDLLQTDGNSTATPVTGGVLEMRALYGIDSDDDGKINYWASATGTYAPSALMDGSTSAAETLQTIKAIKVGLILRTALSEKTSTGYVVTATAPSLFDGVTDSSGTSLKYTRAWQTKANSEEQNYRYRTVEVTVPLRNNIILDAP